MKYVAVFHANLNYAYLVPSDDTAFYRFGFAYDLPGTERALHFPFRHVAGVQPGTLRTFLRTDRVAQFGVRFFMGMDDYSLDEYVSLIRKYSEQPAGEPEGALIVFADDAEYIGTSGWFRLKFQNQPDRVFERVPDAQEKLIGLITACEQMGSFTTFDDACNTLPALRLRGGYIPHCDHSVPEEVSLENYLHFRKRCIQLGS